MIAQRVKHLGSAKTYDARRASGISPDPLAPHHVTIPGPFI